jgi:hypothetical protein
MCNYQYHQPVVVKKRTDAFQIFSMTFPAATEVPSLALSCQLAQGRPRDMLGAQGKSAAVLDEGRSAADAMEFDICSCGNCLMICDWFS